MTQNSLFTFLVHFTHITCSAHPVLSLIKSCGSSSYSFLHAPVTSSNQEKYSPQQPGLAKLHFKEERLLRCDPVLLSKQPYERAHTRTHTHTQTHTHTHKHTHTHTLWSFEAVRTISSTINCHTSHDSNLQQHLCKNLKSHTFNLYQIYMMVEC
jgi:ABC-type Zn2+ transport system substrate-binding protein/surface adhesin